MGSFTGHSKLALVGWNLFANLGLVVDLDFDRIKIIFFL